MEFSDVRPCSSPAQRRFVNVLAPPGTAPAPAEPQARRRVSIVNPVADGEAALSLPSSSTAGSRSGSPNSIPSTRPRGSRVSLSGDLFGAPPPRERRWSRAISGGSAAGVGLDAPSRHLSVRRLSRASHLSRAGSHRTLNAPAKHFGADFARPLPAGGDGGEREGGEEEPDDVDVDCFVGGLVAVSNLKERATGSAGLGLLSLKGAVKAAPRRTSCKSRPPNAASTSREWSALDPSSTEQGAEQEPAAALQRGWIWEAACVALWYVVVLEAVYSAGASTPFLCGGGAAQIYAAVLPVHAIPSSMMLYEAYRQWAPSTTPALRWAVVHLLPALPLSAACYALSEAAGAPELQVAGRALGAARLLGLSSARAFMTNTQKYQNSGTLPRAYVMLRYGLGETLAQIFSFLLVCHVCAVVWMVIRRHGPPESAADAGYFPALYFVVCTLTSVGYGDVAVLTNWEKLYCIAMFVAAMWVNGLVIGVMTVALARANASMQRSQALLLTVGVASDAGVSDFLMQQMLASKRLHLDSQFDSIFPECARRCPDVLQRHLEMWARFPLLREMEVLRPFPDYVCAELAMMADELCIYPGCPLVIRGQGIAHLYLLASGACSRKNASGEEATLRPGSGFGCEGAPQVAEDSVTSLTTCEFFIIKGSAFQAVKKRHGYAQTACLKPDAAARVKAGTGQNGLSSSLSLGSLLSIDSHPSDGTLEEDFSSFSSGLRGSTVAFCSEAPSSLSFKRGDAGSGTQERPAHLEPVSPAASQPFSFGSFRGLAGRGGPSVRNGFSWPAASPRNPVSPRGVLFDSAGEPATPRTHRGSGDGRGAPRSAVLAYYMDAALQRVKASGLARAGRRMAPGHSSLSSSRLVRPASREPGVRGPLLSSTTMRVLGSVRRPPSAPGGAGSARDAHRDMRAALLHSAAAGNAADSESTTSSESPVICHSASPVFFRDEASSHAVASPLAIPAAGSPRAPGQSSFLLRGGMLSFRASRMQKSTSAFHLGFSE
eukprot:TRINITY_DN857_c2_g2_i1.p1 TRINITY_DN857_c2_g2~~TRINITY_DN857_c2_g2_i1.p1  ORF type:complete len:1001 (+),score=171.31 TRINITY_DN857_c2_g2_i1:132-3134(+)